MTFFWILFYTTIIIASLGRHRQKQAERGACLRIPTGGITRNAVHNATCWAPLNLGHKFLNNLLDTRFLYKKKVYKKKVHKKKVYKKKVYKKMRLKSSKS